MKQLNETRLSRILLIFIIYTILFFLVVSTLKYTLPFILAFCISSLLKYPANYLIKKYNYNITAVSLIFTIVFGGVFIFLIYLLIYTSIGEIFNLSKSLQQMLNNNSPLINSLYNKFSNITSDLDINPIILSSIKNSISNIMRNISTDIISLGSLAVKSFLNFIKHIPYIIMVIIFTLMSTYFMLKQFCKSEKILISTNSLIFEFSEPYMAQIVNISYNLKRVIQRSLISYLILILYSFTLTFLGLTLFKVPYRLLLSFLCALFDILPVLGMPLIYIPLIIIYFLNGNIFTATGLLILFILVFVSRQILEPKMMSSALNISPFLILCSIFIGLEAGGFIGMMYLIFLAITFSILKDYI